MRDDMSITAVESRLDAQGNVRAGMIVPLTKADIDHIFEAAQHQYDYVLGLYRLAFGDAYDHISKMKGWPTISDATAKYIYGLAIAFDKKHHPGVFAGGAWMNKGMSSEKDFPDWQVRLCDGVMEVEVILTGS